MAAQTSFEKQLAGYSLATAKISYYFPDYPHVVNPNWFLWQEYDVWPAFPRLMMFLEYWKHEIEGPIHQVVVTHNKLLKPTEIKILKTEYLM